MTLEQAERLSLNDDFKAFLSLLNDDANSIREDLVYQTNPDDILRTQCKIQVLRGVAARLDYVIESLKPEQVPASDQPAV